MSTDTSLNSTEMAYIENYPGGVIPGSTVHEMERRKQRLEDLFHGSYDDSMLHDPAAIVKFNEHSRESLNADTMLNGIAFTAPHQNAGLGLYPELKESPVSKPLTEEQEEQSAGAVIVEPDGRIWMFSPRNFHLGYSFTFPKGQTLDKGEKERRNPQETAVQEALQETGLNVKIIGVQGDYDRGKGRMSRVYIATRTGGSPYAWRGSALQPVLRQAGGHSQREETAATWLVPAEKLLELSRLNIPRSRDMQLKPNPDIPVLEDTLALMALARQKSGTLEEGYKALTREAMDKTGYADLAPYLRSLRLRSGADGKTTAQVL